MDEFILSGAEAAKTCFVRWIGPVNITSSNAVCYHGDAAAEHSTARSALSL